MTVLELFASCAPGIEEMLCNEIGILGASKVSVEPGGVTFYGDHKVMYRANLELGLASHVLLRIGRFRARHFGEFVRKLAKLPWQSVLAADQPISVSVTSRHSKLFHTGAIEERLRTALAAHGLGGATVDEETPAIPLLVRLVSNEVTISVDTSGEPLHRRGYRLATGKAPLRPDLARALVLLSGWDPTTTLIDPMMGSGTIAIEAAMLSAGFAPGRLREFGFMRFPSFEATAWSGIKEAAVLRETPTPSGQVIGSDRNEGAVQAATSNAERAGVAHLVRFSRHPLSDAWPHAGVACGAIVTNPPHGKRIGKASTLGGLYHRLGRMVLAAPADFRFALIVDNRKLAHATEIPLKTALLTTSGGTKMRVMVRV